jgi:hypothetical protein
MCLRGDTRAPFLSCLLLSQTLVVLAELVVAVVRVVVRVLPW